MNEHSTTLRKFQVFHDEWKGNQVFAIWEVDDNGERVDTGRGPILSLGKFKARILLQFVDQLREWVRGQH